MRLACWIANYADQPINAARLHWDRIPIPINRSSAAGGSPGQYWKCSRHSSTHSRSLRNRRSLFATLDIIAPMAAERLARVALSITTLDRRLARSMEPRAAPPTKRLETVRRLVDAGVPTSVMVAPLIPALNDTEVEKILQEAAKSGAVNASYVLLRLPLEIKEPFPRVAASTSTAQGGACHRSCP